MPSDLGKGTDDNWDGFLGAFDEGGVLAERQKKQHLAGRTREPDAASLKTTTRRLLTIEH